MKHEITSIICIMAHDNSYAGIVRHRAGGYGHGKVTNHYRFSQASAGRLRALAISEKRLKTTSVLTLMSS